MKSAFAQRQIPTLLGLGVLVAALVGGIALIGTGGGVFAPRATAQTTPKNLKMTNIKDTSFTVSFITDDSTSAFVKYGKTPTDLKTQASDDRDQLSGTVGQYNTHYITLRDLDPDTQYYFTVGTATVPKFDSNGQPFSLKTAKRGGNPTSAKTAYGTINTSSGSPADGAIVYMNIDGVTELSALVKGSGSWAIPLSNARKTDLSGYAAIQPTDVVNIFVQGTRMSDTATQVTTIAETQPVPTLTLTSGSGAVQDTSVQATAIETTPSSSPTSLSEVSTTVPTPTPLAASPEASSAALPPPTTQTIDTVDLTIPEKQTVTTSKPTITGKAAPNTMIQVEIHSETAITTQVTTDANGDFVLPLESTQGLEPGEHTITLNYKDPSTGEQKTVVRTFFVSGGSTQNSTLLALANPSPTPYGTSNPYTIPSPSPSPVAVASNSGTATASTQASASASPRVSLPATTSALPESGSTEMTVALILGGIAMIGLGVWSYRYNMAQALIDSEEESP
jgi:hypothetical protein